MPSLELASVYISCRTTVETLASTRQHRPLFGEYLSTQPKITFKKTIHQEKMVADKTAVLRHTLFPPKH